MRVALIEKKERPTAAANPLVLPSLRGTVADGGQDGIEGDDVAHIAAAVINRMYVRIAETRQQHLALEIDDCGIRTDQGVDLLVRADGNDPTVTDRHRLGPRLGGNDRVDGPRCGAPGQPDPAHRRRQR